VKTIAAVEALPLNAWLEYQPSEGVEPVSGLGLTVHEVPKSTVMAVGIAVSE
jgi:hypothetical protein